ncbi:hypothetical protein AVEN_52049-2-1, partial [Araneus ventricosus]
KLLTQHRRVVLQLDQHAAGQEGAREVEQRLIVQDDDELLQLLADPTGRRLRPYMATGRTIPHAVQ